MLPIILLGIAGTLSVTNGISFYNLSNVKRVKKHQIMQCKVDKTKVDKTKVDKTKVDKTKVDKTKVDKTKVDK